MLVVSGAPVPPTRPLRQTSGPVVARATLSQAAREPPSSNTARAYPAQDARPIEPILIPKLRIWLAEFPYATLFYTPETAHLGDLMRIRYG